MTRNDRRRDGDPGPARPGRRAYFRLSRRRGAADLRRACSSRRSCSTSWCATSRARPTPPRAMRARPARSACVLVTSGPGATNAVTGLTDALMDSIPLVCITGQVPTHLIGNDAFQECDTVGITRPCTKHNYLVKRRQRSAARPARGVPCRDERAGRDRWWSTSRRTCSSPTAPISGPKSIQHKTYRPKVEGRPRQRSRPAVEMMAEAKRPIIYTGGGVINSGPEASAAAARARAADRLSDHLDADGARRLSGVRSAMARHARHARHLRGQLAMHDCDVMICIGARFDDRITGRLDAFSPDSKKIHVDIDPSSINKNVKVDLADRRRLRACAGRHDPHLARGGEAAGQAGARRLVEADRQVARRATACAIAHSNDDDQAAIRDRAALRADQGPRRLHHDRGRPAPDVGGAVLQVRGAEPLDDLRRARHDGLRPAGGDRRADRASRSRWSSTSPARPRC